MVEPIVGQCSHADFKYEEIIALLERYNGVKVNLRTLHQLLLQQKQNRGLYQIFFLSFSVNHKEVIFALNTMKSGKSVSKID